MGAHRPLGRSGGRVANPVVGATHLSFYLEVLAYARTSEELSALDNRCAAFPGVSSFCLRSWTFCSMGMSEDPEWIRSSDLGSGQ